MKKKVAITDSIGVDGGHYLPGPPRYRMYPELEGADRLSPEQKQPSYSLLRRLRPVQPLGSFSQFGSEVRMGNGNQLLSPLSQGLPP